MGFLTDGLHIGPGGMSRPSKHRRDASRSRKKHHSQSRSRSSSRTRGGNSIAGALLGGLTGDGYYNKHNSSRASLFGMGNNSRSSLFNFGNRSSYYKRSPRQGFMQRTYKRLKRLIRDLVHYAKRHPWKVFILVVMPLITTGVLGGLLARFGLRIPPSLERMIGVASRAASGDSFGLVSDAFRMAGDIGSNTRASSVARGHDGGMQWEARSSYGSYGGGHDGYDGYDGYRHGGHGGYGGHDGYDGYDGYGYGYGGSRRQGVAAGYGVDSWGNAVADMAKKFF